jgi:hypothetical protein
MDAYIGWWDELEPSDQTDFSNSGDWTSMAVGDPTSEAGWQVGLGRSTNLGLGQPTWLSDRWAHPSVGRISCSLESSQVGFRVEYAF